MMSCGGMLLLVFMQPLYLTYSVNLYRPLHSPQGADVCGKADRRMAISDTGKMSVDSPQVRLLLKKMI